jgi:glucose/arabinose dehydrogenase
VAGTPQKPSLSTDLVAKHVRRRRVTGPIVSCGDGNAGSNGTSDCYPSDGDTGISSNSNSSSCSTSHCTYSTLIKNDNLSIEPSLAAFDQVEDGVNNQNTNNDTNDQHNGVNMIIGEEEVCASDSSAAAATQALSSYPPATPNSSNHHMDVSTPDKSSSSTNNQLRQQDSSSSAGSPAPVEPPSFLSSEVLPATPAPARPQNQRLNQSQQQRIKASTQSSAPHGTVRMFFDETFPSFFRRLSFSPDGALLAVPAGVYQDTATAADIPIASMNSNGPHGSSSSSSSTNGSGDSEWKNTAYLFARGNITG